MNNILSQIYELKKYERQNYIFSRKRVNRGDGKKTLGWIMMNPKNNLTFENKDYNVLYSQKLLLEKS